VTDDALGGGDVDRFSGNSREITEHGDTRAHRTYNLDRDHSSVSFAVGHVTYRAFGCDLDGRLLADDGGLALEGRMRGRVTCAVPFPTSAVSQQAHITKNTREDTWTR
jgi:hypothetical protein